MKRAKTGLFPPKTLPSAASLMIFSAVLWDCLPPAGIRAMLLIGGMAILLLTSFRNRCRKKQETDFANDVCETIDALMSGRGPENYIPYEDTQISKVQGKLLQYYEFMQAGQRQSRQDKQTLQELISDISHQVKTPLANIRMFTDILGQRPLTDEKRTEFLAAMTIQVNKLDFLMQSLIKMSRLETGTFTLHPETAGLYHTIARAVNGIWANAARKDISLEVECDSQITVRHDTKWTAEALGNLLDNAVKYTPEGGKIRVCVRPWQFYTRIDISDTGIGIAAEHYHDVFQRFYRAREAASVEGVGLGLYLARSIISLQKGYISVQSEHGKGSVFSVFLPN